MQRSYTDKNVYEAFLERMDFLFREFDNIFVSFSGGKDSGLLLNMTLDFKRKYYPEKKIGLFHQDFDLADVVLQKGETCDARYASKEEILKMDESGDLVPYSYVKRLLEA